MKKILTIYLLCFLFGCASLGIRSEAQKITAICGSATASILLVTAARIEGKIRDDVKEDINKALSVIAPICGAEEMPTINEAQRTAFDQAILIVLAQASNLGAQ